ncbi:UNVERIFIED_CONTAM: hypothetical protein RMT77_011020 [Armadillidium vulgare]
MVQSEGACPFTFTRELVLHTLLTLALLALLMVQGILLDMYLIKMYHTTVTHYFWLVPDFLLMVGFGVAMVGGYQLNKKLKNNRGTRRKTHAWAYRRKYYLGFNPYSYTMWFLYSTLLVAKISIIFKNEIINQVSPEEFFGPQLLKLLLASAAVVFVFLVEGHHHAVPNSAQNTYLKFLYSGVSLDILDSIAFLSLLIKSESNLFFSYKFEDIIIGFACTTFVLPTLALYNLSITDYKHDSINVILLFTWKMLHLLLTNIPYMVIRLYFWTEYSADISVFIIKNIINIFVTLKESKGEILQITEMINSYMQNKRRVSDLKEENSNASHLNDSRDDSSTSRKDDEFEEVDLTDVKSSRK